jgi:hypothetical protein
MDQSTENSQSGIPRFLKKEWAEKKKENPNFIAELKQKIKSLMGGEKESGAFPSKKKTQEVLQAIGNRDERGTLIINYQAALEQLQTLENQLRSLDPTQNEKNRELSEADVAAVRELVEQLAQRVGQMRRPRH